MVHRTAYIESFDEYAVPKLPITKDDFSVDNFIDQDSVKIGVSGGVLNYNFVKDGTTDTSTRDLKFVSDNRWILRFNLVVNTLTNPSVGTSFGIIGISNKTTTGNENFIGMMIVRNSAGVGSYRALSTNNGLPISGVDSSIFTTVPTTSDNYFIEIKRESVNSARMTIFSDSAYTVVVESRVFTTAGLGAPIDQNIKDLRYIKLQNVIDDGIGGGSIAGTIDNLLFVNDQLGVTFEDDFVTSTNWVSTDEIGDTSATITGGKLIFKEITPDGTNASIAHDLVISASNTNWVLRAKLTFTQQALRTTTDSRMNIGLFDENETSSGRNNQDGIYFTFGASTTFFITTGDSETGFAEGPSGNNNSLFTRQWGLETLYLELERTSLTTYIGRIYSDSAYTNLIEKQSGTATSTLNNLRYIKIQNDGDPSTDTTSTLVCEIDNVEFFNGQGVSFQDDLTTSTNWASTGTKVTISGGKINWDAKATDTLAQGVSHDFGVGVVNGKSWTLRFKFTVDTFIFQTSNSMDLVIGLFAEDHTKKADVTTTGWHGIYGNWAVTNPLENVAIITSDGSAITGGTLPSLLAFNGMYNSHATIQTAYCELKRTSATLAEFNIYQDPAYSVLLSKGIVAIQAGLTEDLRYLMVKTFDNAVVVGGSWSGTVDDVEFYNGIAPRPLLPRLIDTFQEDFSEPSPDWQQTGTKISVNTITDVIDWDGRRDSTNHGLSHDLGLGFVNNINWVLRFKYTVSTLVFPSSLSGAPSVLVGIGSNPASTSAFGTWDAIQLHTQISGNPLFDSEFRIQYSNGGSLNAGGGTTVSSVTNIAVGTYYVQLSRISDIKANLSIFSDSDFTQLIESLDITMTAGGVSGLRYLYVKTFDTETTPDGSFNGVIDNIEFINGVSVANTVKTPVLDIEFDFSTSNGWVQTGTGVSIDTTLGQITGWGADATDRRVTFDMGAGGILSEQNWTIEFEYEYSSTGSSVGHGLILLSDLNQDVDATVGNDAVSIFQDTPLSTLTILYIDNGDIGAGIQSITGIPIVVNTRYYVRFERIKNTTFKLSTFSDPDFTQHIAGSPIFLTIPSTVDGLRYLHSQTFSGGSSLRVLTGFLKNLKLYRTTRGTDKDNKYLVIG